MVSVSQMYDDPNIVIVKPGKAFLKEYNLNLIISILSSLLV